jgi:hypothetical protein
MTIRTMILTVAGVGVLATGPAPAQADAWHFAKVFRSLAACQAAGQGMVAHRQARAFRCENDYDKAGVPVLDLYTR